MRSTSTRTSLAAVLAISALALGGCASVSTGAGAASPSASSTPTVSEPPSTPVVETTLEDEIDGTRVTPLAIVTDFPAPEGSTAGLHPVLIKVELEAGDVYGGSVHPSVASITRRDGNLDYITLGMGNPKELVTAMTAAGYTPLQAVPAGESQTGWIGAWLSDDVSEYDLVYNRNEGKVIGGSKNGETVAASRSITPLTAK
ncbi:hypothetical protein KXS11_09615 [Plantibacter flavus]|uniref:hypothetical protein n=1 Tax=Plantibacter flavus TaxID=150123 RepID=UPI003F1912E1